MKKVNHATHGGRLPRQPNRGLLALIHKGGDKEDLAVIGAQ